MSKCQRCHTETRVTTGSIFNTEMICMNCKSDETFHPRYKEAVEKEADFECGLVYKEGRKET